MKPRAHHHRREQGRGVEALLIVLKQLTGHLRWVFAALLLVYAASGIRTVQPDQQVLVVRFGHLLADLHGPGLLLGLPSPFDRLLTFETGREFNLTLDQWAPTGEKTIGPDRTPAPLSDAGLEALGIPLPGESSAASPSPAPVVAGSLDPVRHGYTLTRDFNLLQGRFALRYRITDPLHFTLCGEDAPPILERLTYQALSRQIGSRPIDASLTTDRQSISSAAAADVQRHADALNLGIRISGLDVVELSPPSQVLAAFEEVVSTRQSAKTLLESSRQYEAETLARTRGEASSLVLRAESDAATGISAARAEAASFEAMLIQYQRSPDLVSRRLLRETVDAAMGRVPSRTFVPAGGPAPSILVEPLPVGSP